jgi:hypothetical protein
MPDKKQARPSDEKSKKKKSSPRKNETEKRGRPSQYTTEIALEICKLLSEGKSLRSICEDEKMPHESTVRTWARDDLHGFFTHYARARDIGLDSVADEVLEIADDGRNDWMEKKGRDGSTFVALNDEAIARSRIRFDARRWYLSKMAPKRYGDKIALAGDAENPIAVKDVTSHVLALLTPEQLEEAHKKALLDADQAE